LLTALYCRPLQMSSQPVTTWVYWQWCTNTRRNIYCDVDVWNMRHLWFCKHLLVFSSSRYDHITPLLRQLHWLKAPEWIDYKPAFLAYKCLQGVMLSYLADDLCQTADLEAWRHLRSASSPSLVVRLSTYGDRAFPVAASRVWNSLPHHVTSAQSLPVFCSRLKTYLFRRSFPWLFCCARKVTLVIMDTLIVLTYLHKSRK